MKTDRTILELLILLRENIAEYMVMHGHSGLCSCIKALQVKGLITLVERENLYDYIYDHRPVNHYDLQKRWWPMHELEPRIKFLDELIKEKQDENR